VDRARMCFCFRDWWGEGHEPSTLISAIGELSPYSLRQGGDSLRSRRQSGSRPGLDCWLTISTIDQGETEHRTSALAAPVRNP
jgi:hypothetical protein